VIEDFGKQEPRAFVLGALAPQGQVSDDWPSIRTFPASSTTRLRLGRWRRTLRCPGLAHKIQAIQY